MTIAQAEDRAMNPVWTGERIYALRKRLALSQREMARQIGVRQQTISEWENDQYHPRGACKRMLNLTEEAAKEAP